MATSTRVTKLPNRPFNGQIFIDSLGVKWAWDSKSSVWSKIGLVTSIPVVTATEQGLLSAADKAMIDGLPVAGGGFGIIVSPQMVLQTIDNPDGVIQGDIKLVSDSLTIDCVYASGEVIPGYCKSTSFTEASDELPGLQFGLSLPFLNTLCIEIAGAQGGVGEKGSIGAKGTDGFTDGPAGEKGDKGDDAETAVKFSGIKIVELDTITDTAIVSLEYATSTGTLTYTTAKLNTPDNDKPADRLIATPVQRTLTYKNFENGHFSTLDDWELSAPGSDPTGSVDLLIAKLPTAPAVGKPVDISVVKLSELVALIVKHYKNILCGWQTDWEKTIREYIESKDEAARRILGVLAQSVAECEFTAPLEFCLGVEPSTCEQPRVVPTVLVQAREFNGSCDGPLDFNAENDHTGQFVNWRTWGGPDQNADGLWDINVAKTKGTDGDNLADRINCDTAKTTEPPA